jgi:Tfp pilus assembly protein PilF
MPLRQRLRSVFCCIFAFLLLSFLPVTATFKDTWIEVRSPNFQVISNAGDKEARKLADQFEQFREVFHTTFPQLRVDLGKPLIIFAVKNEDSLKALIPAYWESKGHLRPAGIYAPGEERHYVAVRTDVATENPYEIVYHEYTHAIMNLNFRGLPVWLNEGFAEFYGNSVIRDKDVEIGKVAPYHLQTLREQRLIPIDALLLADQSSPYYNEANRATVFYAESWAIVHYLMLDPDARDRKLLSSFLSDWDASGNQLEAAQKSFGDLKKFGSAMESYARQRTFYVASMKAAIHGDPKSFSSRVLPAAEVDAQRALFYAHTHRPKEAEIAVGRALKEDPDLPLAYEAKGILAYSQNEFQTAVAGFARAIELHTDDYFPYYFLGQVQLRNGMPPEGAEPQMIANLKTAIQMNPQFAPAYAALASVYSMNAGTREKAYPLAQKAMELEPGNLGYATNYGYVLANTGKTAEAKTLALRIEQAAKTPMDRANAEQLLAVIASHEEYDHQVAEMKSEASRPVVISKQKSVDVPGSGAASTSTVEPNGNTAAAVASNAHRGESEYAVEGIIVSVDCGSGAGKVTLGAGKTTMNFRFAGFAGLEVVSTAKQDSGSAPPCANWKGRRVRIYFFKGKTKEFAGDLNTIQFF